MESRKIIFPATFECAMLVSLKGTTLRIEPFPLILPDQVGSGNSLVFRDPVLRLQKNRFFKGMGKQPNSLRYLENQRNSFIYTIYYTCIHIYIQYVHNIDTIYPKYFKASMIANQPTILKIPIFLPDVPCLNLPPSS